MKLAPTPNLKKHPSGQQSLQERKQSTILLNCNDIAQNEHKSSVY